MGNGGFAGIDPVELTLIMVNLAAGFGCAIPMARLLSKQTRVFRYFAMLIGVYFVECVAVVAGMGIPVFSVGLAFVWGIVFGVWLRSRTPKLTALKTSFLLSIYSSLPAASFIIVPVMGLVSGHPVLSVEEGARFGIPGFLPWPLTTTLGFYATLVIGAVVFKTVITTGEVALLILLGEKSARKTGM